MVSAEYHHRITHRTGSRVQKKWMDGCFGQANNKTMVKFNIHITDPDSPMYMYERIDEHVCVKGHSYMPCDAG